ncbi:Chromatin assembly factor 1, subunit A [Mortierella sp. NVP85]|nr:Chromatin assembly factor 1, subunit A [Mortierella sp. NVP85]
MPPKVSSPVQTRTLGSFFSKKEAAPSSGSTEGASTPKASNAANESGAKPPSPEKEKPKKRAVRANGANTTKNQPSASADAQAQKEPPPSAAPSTASPKPKTKAAGKKEIVTEVVIPVTNRKASASTAAAKANASTDSTTLSVAETTKETPRSPNKSAANGTSTSNSTAPPGSSSNISKLNKVDTASMIRVRGGKASITENKLKFSSHPSAVADLCKFHEYRERLREAEDLSQYPGTRLEGDHVEITSIPEDHYGLIAKLVEESELLLPELAASFMTMLCPLGFDVFGDFGMGLEPQNGDDEGEKMDVDGDVGPESTGSEKQVPTKRSGTTISIGAIAEVIQAVAQRVNYGVPVSSLPNSVTVTPPNLSVYRWEVQDIDRYFPSDMRAAVTKRRSKRMEASAALTVWFLGLDAKQQEELCPAPAVPAKPTTDVSLGSESSAQATGKRGRLSMGGEGMDIDGAGSQPAGGATDSAGANKAGTTVLENQLTVEAALDPAILESKIKEAEAKKKEAEAKEERRLEKERKMAERQIEKDLKEAERQQKEEAKKRKAEEERVRKEQTSMRFVGFFKPIASPAIKKDGSLVGAKNDTAASSFSELFHPFHVKKHTTLAPINRFAKDVAREEIDRALDIRTDNDASLEEESCDMEVDSDLIPTLDKTKAKAIMSELFRKTSQPIDATAQQRKKKLPRHCKSMTVQEVIQSGLLVQEEGDDTNYVLSWKDIPSLRMRLFQFAENYRPAYYGTWSKRSKCVNGRRILGKDTEQIDYEFDSEAEWEEDEEGEECKSDDEEEDAEDLSDQDEEDDWLVPEGYLSEDEGLDAGDEPKPKVEKKSKESRRPALAQMTPIIVGPVFEVTLGECSSHPALESYHIEFLGDYGIGMDMYHAVEPTLPTSV